MKVKVIEISLNWVVKWQLVAFSHNTLKITKISSLFKDSHKIWVAVCSSCKMGAVYKVSNTMLHNILKPFGYVTVHFPYFYIYFGIL